MSSVVFRTDASTEMGTGHVMRCLALAEGLRDLGTKSRFICREHRGNLIERIAAEGHEVAAMPVDSPPARPPAGYASWVGGEIASDARQTLSLVPATANWMIVDHYGLDARWEGRVRQQVGKVMVIDDLANRPHCCDLLLDQTLGRRHSDYAELVPAFALVRCGATYAMLRPEFGRSRAAALAGRGDRQLRRVLVTLGGSDPTNVTAVVLRALQASDLPDDAEIVVVAGPSSPCTAEIMQLARLGRIPTRVVTNVSNMAELMFWADLAVGAAGSTAWERCCLGLPTVMTILADNQKFIALSLEDSGAVLNVGDANDPLLGSRLQTAIAELVTQPSRLAAMSDAAARVTEGTGASQMAWQITSMCHT
jgi:UDP-2,4-diacetamido-2,4,6-trideoxy-beta-L-altropyranose hydrolase